MPTGRPRKLTRVQVSWLRLAARKQERFVVRYQFPPYLWGRLEKRLPTLSAKEIELVERGLREWFICCAWRWGTVLGMPSRAVDEAWHEFILDTRCYTDFCAGAFGDYLHHMPDEAMTTPMGDVLGETVRAWDRSKAGRTKSRSSGISTGSWESRSRWGSTPPPSRQLALADPSPQRQGDGRARLAVPLRRRRREWRRRLRRRRQLDPVLGVGKVEVAAGFPLFRLVAVSGDAAGVLQHPR